MKLSVPAAALCLAASAWAQDSPVTAPGDATVSYVESPTGEEITLGGPIRPCMCHGAYAGLDTDEPFSFNLTGGYDSSYICRGLDVGDNSFNIMGTVDFQVTDDLTWTTSALTRHVVQVDFDELNLYTGLFYTAGNLTIGPSFRWWNLRPEGGEANVYDLGVQALYKLGKIDLTAGCYYDFESEGSYYEIGATSTIPIHDRVSLVPSAQISYTDGWLMPQLEGFNYLDLRVWMPIEIVENVILSPYLGGAIMLAALEESQDSKVIGGVTLSFTF